jgi:hypothetical protein
MGSIVPPSHQGKGLNEPRLLVFDASVKGVVRPVKVLIDSGASENFASKSFVLGAEALTPAVRFSNREVAVRLADGSVLRDRERSLPIHLRFLDFDSEERF